MRQLLEMFPVKRILAVDGGASKVDVALLDVDGKVHSTVRRRGRFNFGLGSNGSLDGLAKAVREATGGHIAALGVYCLAGADLPLDDRRIAAEVESQRWSRKTLVRNDTFAVLRAGTDRKSTRLNSSHPSISYAVFCLKKKTESQPSRKSH